ncbi:type II toxin-antitoxin system ChpB family toxin [Burkholderia contaminans]|uniref:type II toxin-antitoxin system ChpB family toxin n=1 Tax=Burkholderia contaminans TaxID=488447 RepID=UPI00264B3421|nr:type II toxin-antitoxin system ChpB family toxin [Burkholderia contaminans]MDN7577043.1 type II toxin-antitoxin system ChpB family toxin [Burkholderia contaminans]
MLKRGKFDRGDIVRVNLTAQSTGEQAEDYRLALVLSPTPLNSLGLALVAPISQGDEYARFAGFAVQVSDPDKAVCGVALVNFVRMLDLDARGARKVGQATPEQVADALARLQAIVA